MFVCKRSGIITEGWLSVERSRRERFKRERAKNAYEHEVNGSLGVSEEDLDEVSQVDSTTTLVFLLWNLLKETGAKIVSPRDCRWRRWRNVPHVDLEGGEGCPRVVCFPTVMFDCLHLEVLTEDFGGCRSAVTEGVEDEDVASVDVEVRGGIVN